MSDKRHSNRSKPNRASATSKGGMRPSTTSPPSARARSSERPAKVTQLDVTESAELMKFLVNHLANKGRNKIKSLLSHGQISVDGKVVTRYDYNLSPGQKVTVHWSRIDGAREPQGLTILFEDDHLIVIDKQAGLLTVATEDEKHKTAYHQLMDHVRTQHPKQRVFVVHRLDRDTSGVMMFAKSEAVQERLQETWKDTVLQRTYVVLVEGRVAKEKGTITSWLKESSTLKMFSSRTPNDGQKAITHFKVIESGSAFTLLEVELETGRKNQIRVHMQDIGHSVAGDHKYGSTKNPIGRLGLHALRLVFRHPVTQEILRFEAQIPKKFRAALHSGDAK